jgi:hypothetical protein
MLTATALALLAGLITLGIYGPNTIGSIGTSVEVLVRGVGDKKVGGVTLDWATVAAVGSDTTWNDGVIIYAGQKGLRYGQVVAKITAGGKYGPYDPAAADGRQNLVRGECFILNRSASAIEPRDDYPEVIYGGDVWLERIIQSGVAAHTLALGPTLAELLAAFPRLQPFPAP